MAKLKSKARNALPDSAFAYIDSEGGRHLPMTDASGNMDANHIRNALARLNQVQGMSDSERARVKAKLEAALRRVNKNASEHYFLNVLDFSDLDKVEMDAQGRPWVDAFKAGDWHDPRYGVTKIDDEYLDSIIKNFNDNVRGIEIAVDYDHGADAAKGNKAAGWIRALRRVGEKVQAAIEFTEEATAEIKDRQWRYFSPKFADEYMHSEGGQVFGPTMLMGSLTNTPVFKGMAPINFSEAVLDADMTLVPEDTKRTTELGEEGVEMDEAKLREMLGIGADVDIEATIKQLQADGKAFSELRRKAEAAKSFAEQFPEQAKENEELKKRVARAEAKDFAESFMKPVVDDKGNKSKVLPPVVTEKLEEAYFEFSEGRGTVEGLREILDTVRSAGLVTLGEGGSSIDDDHHHSESTDLVKSFAEEMGKVMRAEGMAPQDAMMKVAESHPELYKAYIEREIPVK